MRDLAAELDARLRGRRVEALVLERDALRLTLAVRGAKRDALDVLVWALHPNEGQVAVAEVERRGWRPPEGARVQLPDQAAVEAATAPADERMLRLDVAGGVTLVVELMTNAWNAVVVGGDGRVQAVLRQRQTKRRELRPGVEYETPAPGGRAGAERPLEVAQWLELLAPVEPSARLGALPGDVAWTSPLNAAAILGTAAVRDDEAALRAAYERYREVVWGARTPVCCTADGRVQPYGADLGGCERVASLLAAFERAAGGAAQPVAAETQRELALSVVAARLDALDRREERLRLQLEGAAAEARRLRGHADVLLAQLHLVTRGAADVELPDFEGGTVTVALDPSLTPAANAQKLYEGARRRERAAERVPKLLRKAERERAALESLAARLREGTAEAAEIGALVRDEGADARRTGRTPEPLPYRRYRTSGGLEVRVGRGAKSNDALTFHHSSPNDIWLHARDVAGAHVILRWTDADANPPAAAIAEAAVLAARHSKARTSGMVPVDWTRRKYVRKPRKAPPGAVLPERVKTVFVEPG